MAKNPQYNRSDISLSQLFTRKGAKRPTPVVKVKSNGRPNAKPGRNPLLPTK